MQQVEDLLNEISQIKEQYQNEVPGRRRQMPESIKERVFALFRMGLNSNQIAKRTGLPYFTILRWKKQRAARSGFELVKVTNVKAKRGKPAVAKLVSRSGESEVDTVTVSNVSSTVSVVMGSGV